MSKTAGKTQTNLKTNEDVRRILEILDAIQPFDVKGQYNVRTNFWRDILYRKISTIFEIEGAPPSLNTQVVIWHLLVYGWAVICNIPAFGIVTCDGAYAGLDFYYLPTEFTPSNPAISDAITLKFGKDAVFGFLSNTIGMSGSFTPKSAIPIIDIYAEKLASIDASIDVNLMNSRVAFIATAENEAQAATLQKVYTKVTSGEPLVLIKDNSTKNIGSDGIVKPFYNDIQSTFIADKLQNAQRTIMNEFLTLIGIDNVAVEKKERVQTSEVQGNNEEIENAVRDWEKNITNFIKSCNKILGTDMTLKRGYGNRYGNTESIRPSGN